MAEENVHKKLHYFVIDSLNQSSSTSSRLELNQDHQDFLVFDFGHVGLQISHTRLHSPDLFLQKIILISRNEVPLTFLKRSSKFPGFGRSLLVPVLLVAANAAAAAGLTGGVGIPISGGLGAPAAAGFSAANTFPISKLKMKYRL